ncbi:hypothetical protein CCACVL1_10005, partial [Corchorus capsularis]
DLDPFGSIAAEGPGSDLAR